MPIPEIDFRRVRPHGGGKPGGFEELCCQLASLEYANREGQFYRKGLGGDAGVECFFRNRAGRETGWQAKYFFNFTAVQVAQLDDSLKTALKKHPNLQTYIVCLPFDFKDPRRKGQTSELKRWERWRIKSIRNAKNKGRKLAIILWGATFLRARLSQDDSSYAGRTFYWFESTVLTDDWFLQRFNEAKANLGERYTPEVSVEVQIRRGLLALARGDWMSKQLDEWNLKVQERTYSVVRQIRGLHKFGVKDSVSSKFMEALEVFVDLLRVSYEDPRTSIPVTQLVAAVRAINALNGDALALVITAKELNPRKKKPRLGQPTESARDATNYARHEIYRLHDLLEEVEAALKSDPWSLVNKHKLLVYGKAGSGKSHLLADIADHQLKLGRPAILILGQTLVEGDPWQQIRSTLDLQSLSTETFLGALDAAGQASGVRTLVLVDAINERNGLNIWPTRLAAFLKRIEKFQSIAVVLSCRTTYLDRIVPSSVRAEISQLEHVGFSGKASEAAQYYLAKRGIVRPGMPNFLPEFNNPLFLKTICDALKRSGVDAIPKGLQGVTAVFGFYIESVAGSLEKRMALDPHRSIVSLAISQLVDAMIKAKRGWLKKADALALLEAVHQSRNRAEESLLFQLENEGLITIEAAKDVNDGELVRFTFERMSDHLIARALLDLYLDRSDPKRSFSSDGSLAQIAVGRSSDENGGLLEAMAIQLPELIGAELIDVATLDDHNTWRIVEAFKDSLLWRNQACFSDRAMQLCEKVYKNDEAGKLRILISISTEPGNKFNALWLHARLNQKSLPERDESWSTFVAEEGEQDDSPLWTLIYWAFEQGGEVMDQTRRELAAVVIGWFLTTTHRGVRDRATKALARLLSADCRIATATLRIFANVNDPYVAERIYAAVYGAVLQGQASDGLAQLCEFIFDTVFKDSSPPPYALLRDSARGVLEYASMRGLLPGRINLELARPPYKALRKIEFVSEEAIKRFTQTYDDGAVFPDQIVSSTVSDGDFARYVIDGIASSWSATSIGETWYRLMCIVVAKAEAQKLLEALTKRRLTSPHDLPSLGFPEGAYLGEYPWHPVCADFVNWTNDSTSSFPVSVRPLVASYTASRGGFDYSIDETIHVAVPAPWLMSSISLSLESGRTPRYVDKGGVVRFLDPAIFEPGPHAALFDEEKLREWLVEEELEAFWIIAGEKSVYGDMWAARGFGGRYVHTAVYQRRNDGKFKRHFYFEMELPYEDQLAALFDNEIPQEFRKLVRVARPAQIRRSTVSAKAGKMFLNQAAHSRALPKRHRR